MERIFPGDRFVEEAVSTARSDVEKAADQTLRELHDKSKPLTSSDLLALFKFPSQGAQSIARSAEIFERTLELIVEKVHEANQVEIDNAGLLVDCELTNVAVKMVLRLSANILNNLHLQISFLLKFVVLNDCKKRSIGKFFSLE